jgi:glycosyltransferase involved in cell wall biosynthesis
LRVSGVRAGSQAGSTAPRVAFLAWTERTERADEIAESLGGVARRFDGRGMRGPATAPLRYLINTVLTVAWLVRNRPRAVITQNPPVVLGGIAWLYGLVAGVPVLLDSHPVSFGRKESGVWSLMVPIHRFLAVRARLVLVTAPELADEVRAWGGRATEVHEAPPVGLLPTPPPAVPADGRLQIFYVGVFAPDEPIEAVIDAARLVPEVDIHVTGDVRQAPAGLIDGAPGNVRFVGFLRREEYQQGLQDAHAVMSLTTEPTSVIRAGYEAVYASRPLITSDWPVLRAAFPFALHAVGDATALAAALRELTARYPELGDAADRALEHQRVTWDRQRGLIETAIAA